MLLASFDVGIVNMSLCVMDNDENIKFWSVFSIKSPSAEGNCRNLFSYLDKVEILDDVNIVLIERQPSVNCKARVIEGYILSYFTLRNMDKNLSRKIVKYSPKHKLKIYKGPIPKFELRSSYAVRKKTSMYITQQMIKNQSPEFIETFNNNKKKQDDLADSYCQAVSYIRFVLNSTRYYPPPRLEIIQDSSTESDSDALYEEI